MFYVRYILGVFLIFTAHCVTGRRIEEYITGGRDAEPGEHPYQVLIEYSLPPLIENKPICGGSIINDQWILTSAQCILSIPRIATIRVKAGKHFYKRDDCNVQVKNVILRLIHSKFKGTQYRIRSYDIGLLKLENSLKINHRVQPIGLPKAFTVPKGNATLSGWGSVSHGLDPRPPRVLQSADLKIITEENCNDALNTIEPTDPISDLQICTGPLDTIIGACAGDTGNPLVKLGPDGDLEQVGIVSWSPYPCIQTGQPTVYTLVSAFVYWIQERTSENL